MAAYRSCLITELGCSLTGRDFYSSRLGRPISICSDIDSFVSALICCLLFVLLSRISLGCNWLVYCLELSLGGPVDPVDCCTVNNWSPWPPFIIIIFNYLSIYILFILNNFNEESCFCAGNISCSCNRCFPTFHCDNRVTEPTFCQWLAQQRHRRSVYSIHS